MPKSNKNNTPPASKKKPIKTAASSKSESNKTPASRKSTSNKTPASSKSKTKKTPASSKSKSNKTPASSKSKTNKSASKSPKKSPNAKRILFRRDSNSGTLFKYDHDDAVECLYPTEEGEQHFPAYICMKICADNIPYYNVYFPEDKVVAKNQSENRIRKAKTGGLYGSNRKIFLGAEFTQDAVKKGTSKKFYIEGLGVGKHVNDFYCERLVDDEGVGKHEYVDTGEVIRIIASKYANKIKAMKKAFPSKVENPKLPVPYQDDESQSE